MRYIICKLCNDVMESSATWRIAMNMQDHIREQHPDVAQRVEADQERYSEELGKLKEPDHLSNYLLYETMPKDAGRKEFEGKITRFHERR